MSISTLNGRLTVLRPMRKDDLVLLHKWLNDPDVMQYWDGRDHPATFDRVEARFRKSIDGIDRDAHRFMIEVDGEAIGMVQHGRVSPRAKNAQVDLLIGDAKCRDSGYGTDAMLTFITHLFGQLRCHRVWLTLRATNVSAMRGATKCGFTREGVLRQHDQLEGAMVDVVVYGMLASEWRAGSRPEAGPPSAEK